MESNLKRYLQVKQEKPMLNLYQRIFGGNISKNDTLVKLELFKDKNNYSIILKHNQNFEIPRKSVIENQKIQNFQNQYIPDFWSKNLGNGKF